MEGYKWLQWNFVSEETLKLKGVFLIKGQGLV